MSFIFATEEREKFSERSVRTFAVGPGGLLGLDSTLGSFYVDAGATENVTVEVLLQVEADSFERAGLKFKDLQLSFAQNGNDVEIHSEFRGSKKGLTLEFHISVPRNYNLKLNTGAGSIEVVDVCGNVSANSGGGSIHIERVNGLVMIQTAGGSIRVEQVTGEIKALTKGGNVAARMSDQLVADCYLSTSGGKVVAELNRASAFAVDAKTRAGSVITEFPITMQGKLSGNCCQSSINGGGPKLVLRSAAGNIHLLIGRSPATGVN
jgi:hypothetical protein